MKSAKETLDNLLGWKDAVLPEPPETISYENCINFMDFYASQIDDMNVSDVDSLDSFNTYLVEVANTDLNFRCKVKQLKRVIDAITNH